MDLINKKILVIGLGSIGERHVRNLRKLGCNSIYVLRRKNIKPRTINFEDYSCIYSIEDAIKHNIDAAIIASPSNNHTEYLNYLVNKRIPVLIEVPISNKIDSLQRINDHAKVNKVPILVGHNIKYHPSLMKIYDLIKSHVEANTPPGVTIDIKPLPGSAHPLLVPNNHNSSAIARKVLTEKIDDLHKLAKALLTYETLTGAEIEDLINKNIYPKNKEDLKVEDDDQSSALGSMGLKPKIVH